MSHLTTGTKPAKRVAVVIDHFSRRAMGLAVFQTEPDSREVRSFLGRAMHQAQAKPKYLICDIRW